MVEVRYARGGTLVVRLRYARGELPVWCSSGLVGTLHFLLGGTVRRVYIHVALQNFPCFYTCISHFTCHLGSRAVKSVCPV